jgi:hypothetical protein
LRRRSHWLAALCLLAFALSCAYIAYYLRGGPRIIDATSYFLEARSLSQGSFSFVAPEPTAAFHGRFLLASEDGRSLSVLFPPGYPVLLALGMRLGAPLLVGPLLGGLLVAATYFLARALSPDAKLAWLAAALSALCAALRYHSADTMSHALAALLSCVALGLALRPALRGATLGCGLCLGWLAAARPIDAVVALALCGFALRRSGMRAWLLFGLGVLPGVALLLLHQRAATGSWLESTQLAYYAASDAPPGCFRYGFGAGVGCRFEHGDFVSRFLPEGYGLRAALRNLLVHLGLFTVDATNAVPLTLLGAYAAFRHLRSPFALLTAGVVLQALAYVPFYFDGSYPGGGARFLSPAIPLCQILVARAALDLRLERWAVPAALAGFLLHARHGHDKLREREGGRPMFEPQVLAAAGVTRGLLLIDTDHGFNLGHHPGVTPDSGVLVARRRGDGHDRELYERLGRPPTYRYLYDVSGSRPPEVVSYVPPPARRYEAEAEWPALLERGSAYPVHFPCASAGRGLRLFPGTAAQLSAAPASASVVGWFSTRPGPVALRLGWVGAESVRFSAEGPGCTTFTLLGPRPKASSSLRIELLSGEGAVDFVEAADSGPGRWQP